MQPRFRAALVAAFTVTSLSLTVTSHSAPPTAKKAGPAYVALPQERAHDFWRSLNVNTHFSFANSPYDAKAAQQVIDLGFAGVRDKLAVNAKGNPSSPRQVEAFRKLQAAGVKVHSTVGKLGDSPARIRGIVGAVRQLGGAKMFRSLGGVNEPNKGHKPGWAEAVVAHQRHIWEASADLRADGLEVAGPSMYDQGASPERDFAKLAALGIGQYVTHGDFHRYPKGVNPSNGLADRMKWTAMAFDGKSTYATETGYNTGVHITNRGNPVEEEEQAAYAPRLFAEFFKAGVDATFLYALLDDMSRSDDWERYWGQVRKDGTVKPSYRALSYLAHLVKGASPTADTTRLKVAVTPGDEHMRYLNLDYGGKHLLLVWRDVKSTETGGARIQMVFDRRVQPKVHRPHKQKNRTRKNMRIHRVPIAHNLVVIEVPRAQQMRKRRR